MSYFIIFISFFTISIIFVKPKWGSLLIWPVLFAYPHGWWFYNNFLPLNIGFDDLLCLSLFTVVLVRRNFIEGIRPRVGYAFWIVSGFTVVATIANFAGSTDAKPLERIYYYKDILKLGVYWCLFYAILNCIDDLKDLRMQLTAFSIAVGLGASIIVMQTLFPYQMQVFSAPSMINRSFFGNVPRASGSFMNANSAACVMASSLALVTSSLMLKKRLIAKLVTFVLILLLLTAILATQSRSGLMAISFTFIMMAILGRSQRLAWLVIAASVLVALSFNDVREAYQKRVLKTYDISDEKWDTNIEGRIQTWLVYFKTAKASTYLLGQGFRQGTTRNKMESHSAYLSIITVYGLGGVTWAIISLIILFIRFYPLKNSCEPQIGTITSACLWALIAWGVYGTASDAISSQYPRYILFYLYVLLDRIYYISNEHPVHLQKDESVKRLFPVAAGNY
jgi:hypothetical protein